MTGRLAVAVAAATLALGISSSGVHAQGLDDWAFGPRAGLGVSPGTLIVGVQGATPIGSIESLFFEPTVQLGFGDNFKVFEVAGRATYKLEASGDLNPFVFAGLGIYRLSDDASPIDEITVTASRTDVALNLGGGVEKNGFGVEGTVKVAGTSDIEFMVYKLFGR
jgi:hypothetical protein